MRFECSNCEKIVSAKEVSIRRNLDDCFGRDTTKFYCKKCWKEYKKRKEAEESDEVLYEQEKEEKKYYPIDRFIAYLKKLTVVK